MGFLQHVVMALFCIAIGVVALRVVTGSYQLGEVEITLFWPIWPVQALLPVALAGAAVRHALYARYADLRPAESGAIASALPGERT